MQSIPLHLMSREILDDARAAFHPSPITPEMSRDKMMYEAGSVKVLDWIEAKLAAKSSKSEVLAPTEVEMPNSHEGFMRRAMRGSK